METLTSSLLPVKNGAFSEKFSPHVLIRGCHTFSEVGGWVLREWRMRKKRSQ